MFVELHLIQNFAPSCLNRDDTNTPKDCEFGGYRRARVSSQCLKRSVRRYFNAKAADLGIEGHLAQRTKLLAKQLIDTLAEKGKDRDEAEKVVRAVIGAAGVKTDDAGKTSVLLFVGLDEFERLVGRVLDNWDDLVSASGKNSKKGLPVDLADVLREGTRAVDIALFGRMIAELKDLNVDAACQVAHAISTHRVDMEMDFYTAVDDLQPREETGAGMMGIVEFNSSCFYRYAVLDTDQLTANLGGDADLARKAAQAFVEAAVHAIPTGKQNSMAAQNLPVYARLVAREGAPRSLANAFVAPARPSDEKDLALASIEALEKHAADLDRMYGADGVKLDEAASTYDGHGDKTVRDLVAAVGEVMG